MKFHNSRECITLITNQLHDWLRTDGHALHYYIDSSLEEAEKEIENDCILEARKTAFGGHYIYVPPWRMF